jgi:hypothetical protein
MWVPILMVESVTPWRRPRGRPPSRLVLSLPPPHAARKSDAPASATTARLTERFL